MSRFSPLLKLPRLELASNTFIKRSVSTTSVEKILTLDPLAPKLSTFRRTKIVCTVGPSTWDEKGISGLLRAGMNVLRVNCSHGDHELYDRVIKILRNCVAEVDQTNSPLLEEANVSCAVALDTKGPEIRLGDFQTKEPVRIEAKSKILLSTNEKLKRTMTEKVLCIDYKSIRKSVKPGTLVFIDDGLLALKVQSIFTDEDGCDVVECVAENSGTIGSRKGVNIPYAELDLPAVSAKDEEDLAFARKTKVDFIFASFIRKREHVQEIRKIVGPGIGIIAKIENGEGLRNIDGIIDEADGIMVARGDLGIEIPQEHVFLAQKLIVAKANLKGKPVICATQMLDSMTRSPRPTRAECADTANAVLDGCDAVMLSGETANGQYPTLTVETMSKICQTAEYSIDTRQATDAIRKAVTNDLEYSQSRPLCEGLILSAVVASEEEKAQILLIYSETGISARIAAKYRPSACILCITSNQEAARQLNLCHGIRVHAIPPGMDVQEAINTGIKRAHKWGIVKEGDRVVAVHSQGSVMRLLQVPHWIGRV